MSITQLRLMPFQRIDDHTVYCVRVKVNNFRFHEIKRPFLDYVQFSQNLQQKLSKNNQIPKLKKDSFSKLIKSHSQKHNDRQEELDNFIKSLLTHVPPEIIDSDFFMNFFSDYPSPSRRNSLKRVFSLRRPITLMSTSSESLLTRSATVSVSCLVPQQQKIVNNNSSNSIHSLSSCSDIEDDDGIDEEEEEEEEDDMIKLKIIYNIQNIIIIRVPRSILWEELETQVRHKFALLKIDLPENMALQVTTYRNSTSSSFSNVTGTASVISAQEELSLAMQVAWSCLEKVTLRITL